jgi:hypothetical protein
VAVGGSKKIQFVIIGTLYQFKYEILNLLFHLHFKCNPLLKFSKI